MGRTETKAYTIDYDRPAREPAREQAIRDNLLYYLGEYRLEVKFAEFFYRVEGNSFTGEKYLATNELGPVRNKFGNAIRVRKERGLSVHREVAECLGFQKLEQALINSPDETLFIWVSPPGPREEGYGNYSFTFIGQMIRDETGERIRVIPYRNILSKAEHRASLRHFTPEVESFQTDIDFLAQPVIFNSTPEIKTPEDVLAFLGEQERFNIDWFGSLAAKVGPLIRGYIKLIREGATDSKLQEALFAIENYTIATRDKIVSLPDLEKTVPYLFKEWGREAPPAVAGSCGPSSSTLMEHHKFENKPWEYHSGNCIVCGTKDTWVGPCKICKNCEKKLELKES